MTFDIASLIRPNIATLAPYRCARDDFTEGVLLDANENTHGPAVGKTTPEEDVLELHRYPDPHQVELKQKIADFRQSTVTGEVQAVRDSYGNKTKLDARNICLGVGADESIDMLMRCVCVPGKDKLVVCPPTYGMYSITSNVNDLGVVVVPLTKEKFQIDAPALLKAVTGDASIKLVFLTSPGNPTAELLSLDSVLEFVKEAASKWNGFVVVDEAYIDFASTADGNAPSLASLVNDMPNLVVLQTLSKSFGLAGIRLGITYACKELSHYLNAMKNPYNIPAMTADVASRAFAPEGLNVMHKNVKAIRVEREFVLEQLSKIEGVGRNIGGKDTNFVLVEMLDKNNQPSNEIANKLYLSLAVDNKVVVRFRGNELNCRGSLRITIGTREENKILVEKLGKVLAELRS